MKKLLLAVIGALSLLSVVAQSTNTLETANNKSKSGGYEFTLGGSGASIDGENSVGFDVSVATNPFESAPSLWFGVVQGLAWEPTLSGSTDVNVNWSWHLFKQLYLNTGWSVGAVYAAKDVEGEASYYWRTGPEATFQYYVGDNAFIYTGVNYDITPKANQGFRYSFGVGLAF